MNPFLRALRLRCPLCGARWPRASALDLAPRCAACGLLLDRGESDAFLGAYTLSLFGGLLLAIGFAIAATKWRVLPRAVLYALAVLAITGFALWFHPFSKLLWLAIDLRFRPTRDKDFAK